jgi:Na+-driven multidrug efflux pump
MAAATELKTEEIAVDRIIVEGSMWAAIWHMSWPLLLNMVTISLASFVDVWVAGKLGPDAQAAIGIGGQIWFLMVILAVALSAGTTALVSRYWGAKDYDQAIEACRQSLLVSLIFGIGSTIVGLACAPTFLRMLGASPSVQEVGWQFIRVDLLSQTPFTILWVINAIFRAKGNARVPMLLWAIMTTLIIALDFILCLGPFHIGVAGLVVPCVVLRLGSWSVHPGQIGRRSMLELEAVPGTRTIQSLDSKNLECWSTCMRTRSRMGRRKFHALFDLCQNDQSNRNTSSMGCRF